MQCGFDICRTYDRKFDGYSGFILAHRPVDVTVASWWSAKVEKDVTSVTWEDFKKFLHACFMPSSRMASCRKAMVNMEAIKQPPNSYASHSKCWQVYNTFTQGS
jgi:hypothetical protein